MEKQEAIQLLEATEQDPRAEATTVSLVMWRKWDQFDPETEFMNWARVIARFEVLKFRRTMGRDRHVFHGDLMKLLADASEEGLKRLYGCG